MYTRVFPPGLSVVINHGREYPKNTPAMRFSRSKIRNLVNLASRVENFRDEYLRFYLDHDEIDLVC